MLSCLIEDDDGHWYVCPDDKRDMASAFFEASEKYWEPGSKYEGDAPEQPHWLINVGGSPSLVKFSTFMIDGD